MNSNHIIQFSASHHIIFYLIIILWHITSYNTISHHVINYHIYVIWDLSYSFISYQSISYRTISWYIVYYPFVSYHITSYHFLLFNITILKFHYHTSYNFTSQHILRICHMKVLSYTFCIKIKTSITSKNKETL